MSLPNLLFVTPSMPSPLGTGSMLRAAMTLDALRKRFRVHVLNFNVWSWGSGRPSFLLNRAASYAELPGARGEVDSSTLLERYFPGIEFAAIHTFKLIMARVTVGILAGMKGPRPYLVLDLDDDECTRSARLLDRMEQDNDVQALKRGRTDEGQLRMLEKMMAPRFDALCLAGIDDCSVLAARYPRAAVHHLPNAIDLPDNSGGRAATAEGNAAAKILFVGALYYAPNADGICYFVDQVLPKVQELAGTRITLQVVGADPLRRVTQLTENPAVTIHANVPTVAPYYEEANLCIVPLRVGSGTRIKILEAFSYRRPVVSTHLGAEGLAVTDGEQLLLADEPEAMARACASLLKDHELRERVANSAYDWVFRNHTVANAEAAMDSIYRPVLA
ncbi:MAG: glycosyltransferase family 4 protein [Terracidiphilus sp.]|jgi:glycosyltransferase involved in cell wall biosynthesis